MKPCGCYPVFLQLLRRRHRQPPNDSRGGRSMRRQPPSSLQKERLVGLRPPSSFLKKRSEDRQCTPLRSTRALAVARTLPRKVPEENVQVGTFAELGGFEFIDEQEEDVE